MPHLLLGAAPFLMANYHHRAIIDPRQATNNRQIIGK
jgi:hypothetical protein